MTTPHTQNLQTPHLSLSYTQNPNPTPMFTKLKTSIELFKECKTVIKKDKTLLLFPIISAVVSFFLILSFIIPVWYLTLSQSDLTITEISSNPEILDEKPLTMGSSQSLLLLLYYFCSFFVIIYFNVAFSCATLKVLKWEDATVSNSLQAANKNIWNIILYSLVAWTVGWLLKLLEEQFWMLGKVVIWILGVTWTLMTFFIAPVLAQEDLGIKDSILKSKDVFVKTWGENVIWNISFWLIEFFYIMLIAGWTVVLLAYTGHPIFLVLGILLFLWTIIYFSTISTIYTNVLYLYANNGKQVPVWFDQEIIDKAFVAKKGVFNKTSQGPTPLG